LNNEGTTIIIVTHEKNIAALTKRTIEMQDGKIDRDIRTMELTI
jgi:ABC-type lipoprotein export system ATPase subunit